MSYHRSLVIPTTIPIIIQHDPTISHSPPPRSIRPALSARPGRTWCRPGSACSSQQCLTEEMRNGHGSSVDDVDDLLMMMIMMMVINGNKWCLIVINDD